ncbi:hypothetical protein D3C87_1808690 [compost metagenome]
MQVLPNLDGAIQTLECIFRVMFPDIPSPELAFGRARTGIYRPFLFSTLTKSERTRVCRDP